MAKNGNVDEIAEPDFFPIPKGVSAKVALELSEIAKKDFVAAKVLYDKHLYGQAVYLLQQSVEKSAKAFGLMLGILKVDELRSVSHRSVYALILGMDTFTEHLADQVSWLQTSSKSEVERMRKLGFDSIFEKLSPLVPSATMVRTDKEKIDDLDDAEMWHATLNLDNTNPYVQGALKTLENIPFDKLKFLFAMSVLKKVGKMRSGNIKFDYLFCILRSSSRAYGLSMLTMWHESATRYPPTNSKDYWKMMQYTKEKPLLKKFPFLLKHGKIFCENVYRAAVVSAKVNQMEK
jgi:hypothetical protein